MLLDSLTFGGSLEDYIVRVISREQRFCPSASPRQTWSRSGQNDELFVPHSGST